MDSKQVSNISSSQRPCEAPFEPGDEVMPDLQLRSVFTANDSHDVLWTVSKNQMNRVKSSPIIP